MIMPHPSCIVVALGHPSLTSCVAEFAEQLRAERRYFGRSATPKPSRSMIERLMTLGSVNFGVMSEGQLVAVSRVGDSSELDIAVLADRRGNGIGSLLLRHTIERAELVGHERIVLHSSRRSRPVAAIGQRSDASAIDHGDGRVDIIFARQHRLGLA
jgi:GNAT superfamily N-acetyltransferase|tara:strand:- start:756 stop:1226 length:471 start_codon:yes stop_codon:yes gene_type:complete